jgi:hypothetical protein
VIVAVSLPSSSDAATQVRSTEQGFLKFDRSSRGAHHVVRAEAPRRGYMALARDAQAHPNEA